MRAIVLAAALLLSACVTQPIADPLAAMQAQVMAVRQTCIDMLNRDRLSVEGGTRCLLVTNQAAAAVDAGRRGASTPDALAAATAALLALEQYLKEQEAQ